MSLKSAFTPKLKRRHLVAAGLGLAAMGGAWAQTADFPNRPVTVMTAFPVGSGPDVLLRMVTAKLAPLWGQSIVVDNRPGGAGFIAMEATRRAAADGYTLLMLDSEHLSALPHLYKSRNFEPFKTFDVAAPLFKTSFMIAVSSQSPWKNVGDLIAAAKAKPNGLSYGSWGIGSPGHLGGEWIDALAGTKMTHVAYKDTGQLFTSVANGDVQWSFASIPTSQGVYKSGRIKYLAVAAPARQPQLPNVPTVGEAGGPAGLDINSFGVLLAPKGVPQNLRTKIHTDVLKVLADPEIREKFHNLAFESLLWSVDETLRVIDRKSSVYRDLVTRANITLE